MAANCLSLNPEKTQLMWVNSGKMSSCVSVGSSLVSSVDLIEVLGIKFDRGLSSNPHIQKLISSVASLTGVTRCLRVDLPPDLVAEVMEALLVGKITYGAAAVLYPQLDCGSPCSTLLSTLQVCVNDAAKVVCGLKRTDHLPIAQLLASSGLLSVDRLAVRSVAIEAWKSLSPHGRPNVDPLSSIFGPPVALHFQASVQGLRKPATRFPMHTFANYATLVRNSSHLLRSAVSFRTVKRAATNIAGACPL